MIDHDCFIIPNEKNYCHRNTDHIKVQITKNIFIKSYISMTFTCINTHSGHITDKQGQNRTLFEGNPTLSEGLWYRIPSYKKHPKEKPSMVLPIGYFLISIEQKDSSASFVWLFAEMYHRKEWLIEKKQSNYAYCLKTPVPSNSGMKILSELSFCCT